MNNIKLKKSIYIGKIRIKVDCSPEISKRLRGENHYGIFEGSPDGKTILVSSEQSPSEFSLTFIHECLEAIQAEVLGSELQHKDICAISICLHQILEDLGSDSSRNCF